MQPTPTPALPEEQADAFRLLFQRLGPDEQSQRVHAALTLIHSGELNPEGIFVLRDAGQVDAVFVCLPVPGASALVWPPIARDGSREREDLLVRHALAWLRTRGTRLAQALLSAEEAPLSAALERNGFAHVTDLLYLGHDLALPLDALRAPGRLRFLTYDPAQPAVFHQTLLLTYEATLDCPEVAGVRTIDEVIEGHRAQGRFDPRRWWLACDDTGPVGVILLTELTESGSWEVSYMGVVPHARCRGYGREMLLHALVEARAGGAPRLTLSVDRRNEPAARLYRRVGFEPHDCRGVYLAIWD